MAKLRYLVCSPLGVRSFNTYALANGYILDAAGVGNVDHATDFHVISKMVQVKAIRVWPYPKRPLEHVDVPGFFHAYTHLTRSFFGTCGVGNHVQVQVEWEDGLKRHINYDRPTRDERGPGRSPCYPSFMSALCGGLTEHETHDWKESMRWRPSK